MLPRGNPGVARSLTRLGRPWTLGRAPNNRLLSPQKQRETLLLHGGMEAADNCDSRVAQFPGKVIGLKDQVARTLYRTKKCECPLFQNVQVAKGKEVLRCLVAKEEFEDRRICGVSLCNGSDHQHGCADCYAITVASIIPFIL